MRRAQLWTRRTFLRTIGAAAAAGSATRILGTPAHVRAAPNATLAFWNGLTGPDGRVMEGIVADFMSQHKAIRIEQHHPGGEPHPKLAVVRGRRS